MKEIFKKIYKERKKDLLYALFFPIYLCFYFLTENLVSSLSDVIWITDTAIDNLIPFWPGMITIYCAWYPLLFFTGLYLLINDSLSFRKFITFMIIGFTSAQIFMLLVPNGQSLRPINYLSQIKPDIFTKLLECLYKIDTPTNVFPSVHVIGSFMVMFAFIDNRKLRYLYKYSFALTFLISLSTLFIKQHAFIDIIGGIVFSLITRFIVNFIYKKEEK